MSTYLQTSFTFSFYSVHYATDNCSLSVIQNENHEFIFLYILNHNPIKRSVKEKKKKVYTILKRFIYYQKFDLLLE